MKPKTLKDLEFPNCLWTSKHKLHNEEDLKQKIKDLTIKWVKEDVKDTPTRNKDAWALIFRWMKRLNISEEDLNENDLVQNNRNIFMYFTPIWKA